MMGRITGVRLSLDGAVCGWLLGETGASDECGDPHGELGAAKSDGEL
jgi:hypothetical protein